jgi:hypothetical protein
MKKFFSTKVNLSLFSGFLLGLLFIVACGAAVTSGGEKAASSAGFGVYDKNGTLIGRFMSIESPIFSPTFTILLASNLYLNISNIPSANISAFHYLTDDCSLTAYINATTKNSVLIDQDEEYYFIEDEETIESRPILSTKLVNVDLSHNCQTAGAFVGDFLVGAAAQYTGQIPSIEFPLEIK